MMDFIPVLVDGAVVLNLMNSCETKSLSCEACTHLVLSVHNWIRHADLEYVIIDLQDEKDICPAFLEELLLLRKRLKYPFLFVGVMERPQSYIEAYGYGGPMPAFVTPEDAVRVLRIQYPGLTERKVDSPLRFGLPFLLGWKQFQGEVWSN
ncbi:MAG: hypothetical protein H6618_09165 [Deltaproteobacteria bacterium]|nr:hypothetical protein [Deltaproteobacteria bacterium]